MPNLPATGTFVTRLWRPGIGPAVVLHRASSLIDFTTPEAPTMRDLLERDDLPQYLAAAKGPALPMPTGLEPTHHTPHFLSPGDLQAIKTCSVTFARSIIERVSFASTGGRLASRLWSRLDERSVAGHPNCGSVGRIGPTSSSDQKLNISGFAADQVSAVITGSGIGQLRWHMIMSNSQAQSIAPSCGKRIGGVE